MWCRETIRCLLSRSESDVCCLEESTRMSGSLLCFDRVFSVVFSLPVRATGTVDSRGVEWPPCWPLAHWRLCVEVARALLFFVACSCCAVWPWFARSTDLETECSGVGDVCARFGALRQPQQTRDHLLRVGILPGFCRERICILLCRMPTHLAAINCHHQLVVWPAFLDRQRQAERQSARRQTQPGSPEDVDHCLVLLLRS